MEYIVECVTGSLENPVRAQVKFTGTKFQSADAKSAAKTAFGHTNGVTVSALGITYRLTASGVRKVKQ